MDAIDWIVDAVARYPEATSRTNVRGSMIDLLLAQIEGLAATDTTVEQSR